LRTIHPLVQILNQQKHSCGGTLMACICGVSKFLLSLSWLHQQWRTYCTSGKSRFCEFLKHAALFLVTVLQTVSGERCWTSFSLSVYYPGELSLCGLEHRLCPIILLRYLMLISASD